MSVQTIIDRFEAIHPLQKPASIFKMGDKISGKDAKQTSAGLQARYTFQVTQHTDDSGSGTLTNEPTSASKATEASGNASAHKDKQDSSTFKTQVIEHTDESGSGTLTNEHSSNSAHDAIESNNNAKSDTSKEDAAPEDTPDAAVQTTPPPVPAIETLDLMAIINIKRKGDLFSGGNNLPHEVVYRGTAPEAVATGDLSVKKICDNRRCRVHFRPTGYRRQVPLVKRR